MKAIEKSMHQLTAEGQILSATSCKSFSCESQVLSTGYLLAFPVGVRDQVRCCLQVKEMWNCIESW